MQYEPVPFGRYRLLSLLGRGAMAAVYRAVLPGPMGFEKEVALKTLDREVTQNESYCQALVNEARLGGDLRHRNLVEVYEFDQVDGQYFMAMEYIDGWTLQQLMGVAREQGMGVPLSVAVGIGSQICEGLHYAHTAVRRSGEAINLVHRDLKPANIMVSRSGEVRIMDFGVAKADTNLFQTEDIGSTKGTPIYMSPEQVGGFALDRRSDLFSLGSVLFELVTLEPCFQGNNLIAVLHSIAQSNPQDVVSRLPLEAERFEPILKRCMAPNRDDRYSSARELRRALVGLRRELHPIVTLRAWLRQMSSGLSGPRADGDFGAEGPPTALVSKSAPSSSTPASGKEPVATTEFGRSAASGAETVLAQGARSSGTRSNLSAPTDTFFGRKKELKDLEDRVSAGQRLITILGAAGTGKTRLAKRFGAQASGEYQGGVWFCDLREARTLSGVLRAMGEALNVQLTDQDPQTQLAEALRRRGRTLILLDNFEQVADYAGQTIGRWLREAPEVVFIVTSRSCLHLGGEESFHLAPLPLEEAVVVFYDRARAVQPSFERSPENEKVVAEIVRRLDCMLLAVELAAARVRLLTPEAIRDRLSERFKLLSDQRRDKSERHATLRGAIDWSWDLLRPEEQAALAQLSVFRGGCTLDAAEAVVDLAAFDDKPWVLDVLETLVDHSLIHRVEPRPGHIRYRMLESIREYASEKLAGDVQATRSRHMRHFASLGEEQFLDSLNTHGGVDRLRDLAMELENLVEGVETGLSAGEPNPAASCVLAAAVLFARNGPVPDGFELLQRFTAESLDPMIRGHLCRRRGGLLRLLGRDDEAEQNHQQALALYRSHGDRRGEGVTLANLGGLYLKRNLESQALDTYSQGLAIARQEGERRLEGFLLGSLANLYRQQTRLQAALKHYRQALDIAREVGDRQFEGQTLGQLAILYHERGLESEARDHYAQALEATREVGDRRFEGIAMGNLGELMSSVGEMFAADAYLQQAVLICDELWPIAAGVFRGSLALVRARQNAFDEARELLAKGEAELRDVYPLELAKLLCKRTRVEHLDGCSAAARMALQEAEVIATDLSAPSDSALRRSIDEIRELLES